MPETVVHAVHSPKTVTMQKVFAVQKNQCVAWMVMRQIISD